MAMLTARFLQLKKRLIVPHFPRLIALTMILTPVLTAPAAGFAQAAKPAAPAQQAAADPVVAKVNGVAITRSQVDEVYKALPPQMRQMPLEAIYPALLNEMIARRLINEAAEKAKLGEDAKVKEQLRIAREQVLQQAFLGRTLDREMTDARIQKRYDELIKTQPPRDEVHARHILVANEVDALAALEEVRKGGDFGDISKKRSTGPTAATGGDLGFFTKDQMVPEFAEVAFALQPGQVSQKPVKSQFGWHVIKVEARRVAPPPSLADVRDELSEMMTREIIEETVAGLKKTAKIEQFDLPRPAGQLPTIAPAPARKP